MPTIDELHAEIAALRTEVETLRMQVGNRWSELITGLSAARELKDYATGGATHFTVDVLGYYR